VSDNLQNYLAKMNQVC